MGTLTPQMLRAPAATIDDVIERMDAIDAALPRADGVACFNHMYRAVTVAVRDANARGEFQDSEAMNRLDVLFAGLFFNALSDAIAGGRPPRVWQRLFERRSDPRVRPLQFALAGMNAHINHDLGLAVDALARERGVPPDADLKVRQDYWHINDLLERSQASVRREIQGRALTIVDTALGPLDDTLASWNLIAARDHAWRYAGVLYALGDDTRARAALTESVDHAFALLGRSLLVAV